MPTTVSWSSGTAPNSWWCDPPRRMDTVLLRSWRFLVAFQYRWVLRQPADTLDRGPPWLAPLFERRPLLFPLLAALQCRIPAAPAGGRRIWVTHRSTKIELALRELGEEFGGTLEARAPRRRRAVPSGLVSLRLLARITRLVGRRAHRLDRHVQRSLVQMLLDYAALCRTFAREPPPLVLVPCDLSPQRIALGAAAERWHVPCLYVQLSLFNTYAPPFRPDMALVVNLEAERSLDAIGATTLRRRLRGEVPELRLLDDPPRRIGVVLNNYIRPERLEDVLRRLRHRFPEAAFTLRPHPNSRHRLRPLPEGFRLDPRGRELAAFAREIDLAIVGNSVAQLDLLGLGVPVVHLDGLDEIAFDHCGFVVEGLVCGAGGVGEIEPARIRAFYARPEWRRRLLDRLGLFPDDPPGDRTRRILDRWLHDCLDPESSRGRAACAAS